eukprot:GEMP01006911.1.p1 GENE.GEMP01006911.1~~GEMP01006911.1.p1  ORF type:complete len:1098 (+),score=192.99 GEMP01006911.1:148-3441(+)
MSSFMGKLRSKPSSDKGASSTLSSIIAKEDISVVVTAAEPVGYAQEKIAFSARVRDDRKPDPADNVHKGVLLPTEEEEDSSMWPPEKLLIKAIKEGDKSALKELIDDGVNLDIIDPETLLTPLMVACSYNQPGLISTIMRHSNVNTPKLREFLQKVSGEELFKFGIVGQMREANAAFFFNWAKESGVVKFLIEAEVRWLLLSLGPHVFLTEELVRRSLDPTDVVSAKSRSRMRADFRQFVEPFVRNNGYLNHETGVHILSIVDVITIVTSDFPVVMALMWASIYQTKRNIDEVSEQVHDRAAFMRRTAAHLFSVQNLNQLVKMSRVPFVARLIHETHAIEVALSPRFRTFVEQAWQGKEDEGFSKRQIALRLFPFHLFRTPRWSFILECLSLIIFLTIDMELMYRIPEIHRCHSTSIDQGSVMESVFFIKADKCFNTRLILGVWFTIGSIAYEVSKMIHVGYQEYMARSIWSYCTIGCIGLHAIAWNSVAFNKRLSINTHFFGIAVLLLWLRILQMLCVVSHDFGVMIHAVLQVMRTLSRFLVLIFVFMIAFGTALFAIEGKEMRNVFNLSDRADESFLTFVAEFIYALFVMTFNEAGVKELFQFAHDTENVSFLVVVTGFKLIILLTLMDMVIGVMAQTWTDAVAYTSRGEMMIENMNSAKVFVQLPALLLLPPPLNLVILLLRAVTFPFDWISEAWLWRRVLTFVILIQGFPLACFFTFSHHMYGSYFNGRITTFFAMILMIILSPLLLLGVLVSMARWANVDECFSICHVNSLMVLEAPAICRRRRKRSAEPLLGAESGDGAGQYAPFSPANPQFRSSHLNAIPFITFIMDELEDEMDGTIEKRSKQAALLAGLFAHCRFDIADVGGEIKFSRSTMTPLYWKSFRKRRTPYKFVELLFDNNSSVKLLRLGQMLMTTNQVPADFKEISQRTNDYPYVLSDYDTVDELFPDATRRPGVLEEWLQRFKAVDIDATHDYYHFGLIPLCVLLRGVDDSVTAEDVSATAITTTAGHVSFDGSGISSGVANGCSTLSDFIPRRKIISKNIACLVKGSATDKEEHFLFQMRTEIDNMNEELRSLQSLVQRSFDKLWDKDKKK